MNYFDFIVLYCLKQFNGERTLSAVYHLLKGKRSAQTIQDGKLFSVIHLFQTVKSLERDQLNESITRLKDEGMIIPHHNTFAVTLRGEKIIDKFLSEDPFPRFLNGWVYGEAADIFWKRLSLYIQSLSSLLADRKYFLPINREYSVHLWVKRHFPKTIGERIQTSQRLYEEVEKLLKECSEQEAVLFTYRLSGYHRTGYTTEQLALKLGIDPSKVQFIFQGILHYMVSFIKSDPLQFSMLRLFVMDQTIDYLTTSAKQTFILLEKGKTIEEIVELRRLKRNTIEDHLVEIAMYYENFIIDQYVSAEKQARIIQVLQKVNTKRLKVIKEMLGEQYSYFEIRLVLAKEGVNT